MFVHLGFEGLKIISAAKESSSSLKAWGKTRATRGEFMILTGQSTCHGSIYKTGKAQRHFFDELASRGSR